MASAQPGGGTARGDRLQRGLPTSQLAHMVAAESVLVFMHSFSSFICDAQHRTGRLKKRREPRNALLASQSASAEGSGDLLPFSCPPGTWQRSQKIKTHSN